METSKRFDFIDTMRGLAALYVFIFHLLLVPNFHIPVPKIIAPLLFSGDTGVTLFFVISAFTLCFTYTNSKPLRWGEKVKRFYLKRFLRIAPLYYAWLLFMIVISTTFSWKLLLLSLTFLFNFFPTTQEGIVMASWTLGVEMIFYLLFPIIILWAKSLSRAIFTFLISSIVMVIHYWLTKDIAHYNIYYSLFHQLPVFCIGIVLFYIWKSSEINSKQSKYLLLVFIALFITLTLLKSKYLGIFFHIPFAIAYCALFLGLATNKISFVVNKFTIFIGLLSYSIYLNHPLIIKSLSHLYAYIWGLFPFSAITLLLSVTISFSILLVISYLSYKYIEKPGLSLTRLFIKQSSN